VSDVPEPLPPGRDPERDVDLPGLAALAASAGLRTAEWTARAYLGAARRLLDVAAHPDRTGELITDLRHGVRDAAREMGVDDRVRQVVPDQVAERWPDLPGRSSSDGHEDDTLQEKGEELLRLSRDVRHEYDGHPAYERILSELAPDEGRILRLLLLGGPQPSVDVRTGGPLGMVSSRLIAPGLTMIGARAGLRYVDRVPQYLNNLFRLGLIWFSRETLRDPLPYQVVEAQPEVLEAARSVRMAKIVRRSIHLTPFGEDFCRTVLALDRKVDLATLPAHADPEP
jgi:hypothetical protein